MIRWNHFEEIQELARHSDIPVINGMSDINHPVQALADALTILERFGTLKGVKVSFLGDRTNVANSLALICSKLGLIYTHCAPEKLTTFSWRRMGYFSPATSPFTLP